MCHWLRRVLFFASVTILVSTAEQTFPTYLEEDEVPWLKEELQHHAETSPSIENYLRQIVNIVSYQSQRITSQAAEIAALHRVLSESIQSQEETTRVQKEEIITLRKEVNAKVNDMISVKLGMNAQVKRIKALERKQAVQVQTIQSQMQTTRAQNEDIAALRKEASRKVDDIVALKSEMNAQAKRIKTLERNQAIQIQTIRSQAAEIQDLRDLQTEKIDEAHNEEQADEVEKDVSRRIVLHSDVDILSLVTAHSTDIKNLQSNMTKSSSKIQTVQNEMVTMKKGLAAKASGSTYVRWGRKSCPSVNGTELVYSGFTGGSHYTNSGAASNYLCLSPNPLWGQYNDGYNAGATIWGTEYELNGPGGYNTAKFTGTNVHNEDAPCSVCRSSRPTVTMIPGRNQCYPGWTLEYKGYLVAGAHDHAAASEFVCLDDQPEVLRSGHANKNGKMFYFVEGRCGSLPCPPYVDGRELTCVVCTK